MPGRRLALLALILAACTSRAPTPSPIPTADAAAADDPLAAFTVTTSAGLPPELTAELPLWETAMRGPGAQRLYRDGRLFAYRASDAPPLWTYQGRITPEAVLEVDRQLPRAFARLTAPLATVGPDQAAIVYRGRFDGQTHTWVRLGSRDGGFNDLPTPVTPVEGAILRGLVRDSLPTPR